MPPVFNHDDILERLETLKLTKSPGPDMLHPRVLYEARQEIAYPLALIFNRSFDSKQLPLDWRSANISAIYIYVYSPRRQIQRKEIEQIDRGQNLQSNKETFS